MRQTCHASAATTSSTSGVTAAGPAFQGIIKRAIDVGISLDEGIDGTIRVCMSTHWPSRSRQAATSWPPSACSPQTREPLLPMLHRLAETTT